MAPKNEMVYQLKINLRGSKPPIWRRVQVKGSTTLEVLHEIIQTVMGWEGYHMHQFTIDGVDYGTPDEDMDFDVKDERRVKFNSVVTAANESFFYEYDFGDSWEHEIMVEKILAPESGVAYPVCIDGKMACPPEDSGGIWGYYEMLEIVNDPDNSEHAETVEWLGEDFDPEYFDIDEVNEALERYR